MNLNDIVVADEFSDYIYTIKDGTLVDEPNLNLDRELKNMELQTGKLSILNLFKYSLSNLKLKKIRFFIMFLIMTISLTVFSFLLMLTNFDVIDTYSNAIYENEEFDFSITKNLEENSYSIFGKEEILYFENSIEEDLTYKSFITLNNIPAEFMLAYENKDLNSELYQKYLSSIYYNLSLNYGLKSIETKFENENIIGVIPSKDNEVAISSILADYIIAFGIKVIDSDGVVSSVFFDTYEEIINYKDKFYLDNLFKNYVNIVGIIKDEDLFKYHYLKDINNGEYKLRPTDEMKKFHEVYFNEISNIYVYEGFENMVTFKPNVSVASGMYEVFYDYDFTEIFDYSSLSYLNEEITIYDGNEYKNISNLKSDEIVLSFDFLNYLLNNDDNTSFESLVNDSNIIGSNITLKIYDVYDLISNVDEEILTFKVVGITESFISNYVNYDFIKKYTRPNFEKNELKFYSNNKENITIYLERFMNDEKYDLNTIYRDEVIKLESSVDSMVLVAFYISMVIFIVILFLFFNYMMYSFKINKKDFGVFKSLGAANNLIFKLFCTEGFIVLCFSFVFSILFSYLGCDLANSIVSNNVFIGLEPITFSFSIIYYLIAVCIIIVLLVSFITYLIVGSKKEIDLIYNRK